MAAPEDRAEGEGLFLSGGGAVNLDTIAQLAGAYGAFPPDTTVDAPIDLTALGLINLGLGVELFGGNDVLTLGAVDQYTSNTAAGAYAASGLLSADGGIAAGTGAPGESTTLDLTPVLAAVPGVDDVISELSLDLGAVSASAQATRGASVVTTGDYQVASGLVTLEAPALPELFTSLDTTLTGLSPALDALTADGLLADATEGTLDDLTGVLGTVLGDVVTLEDPTVTAALDLDLSSVVEAATAAPFVAEPVTISLATGEVTIDLDQLYDLNEVPANTQLLSDAAINAEITDAISEILIDQLPARILDEITDADLDITIDGGVEALGLDVGELDLTISSTVGAALDPAGAPAPEVSLGETALGPLDLDDPVVAGLLVDDLVGYVTTALLPAVGDVVAGVLTTDALETSLTTTATGTVTALDDVVALLNSVVAITLNVQESPGTFRDPRGTDAGSFTQRAVRVAIAPGLGTGGAVVLNLASATVRAVPLAVPAGLAATPDRGPVTGGTPVTLTGTDLDEVTAIDFGGVPVDSFTLNPDGTISTVSPAQAAPGIVDITVTSIDGAATVPFEYFAVTEVTTIDPDFGSTEGGDVVTITGECLAGTTAVLFDGVAGTGLTVNSDTQLTVTTPAGSAGIVDVTILNPTECGDATVTDGFTYVLPGAPEITSIVPDEGPETGGTTVVLTGTDFDGTDSVTFGGVPAASFTVDSDTQITAVTPPHAPGAVDVVVTNDIGDSAGFEFTYFDVTGIDDVDPGIGPETGGNTVTITGSCFTGATGITFGGVPATSFTVVSDTAITAVVPAGVGVVDVQVIGAGTCGTGTEEDAYEYVPAPTITDLDPTAGPETGGTVVTITGDGLLGTTGVTFDGVAGTALNVVSDTEIRITTPAHAPGVAEVRVQHPGGEVDAGDFTFLNVPSVTAIDPGTGPDDGGTLVTVTGEGFTGATGVTFGGIPGTGITLVNDGTITVLTPPHVPASVPVVVTHPNGDSAPVPFVYVAGTEIDAITPPGGPEAGGTEVTITGVCFTGATGVLFGATPAASFTVVSDTVIRAVTPAGIGVVDVTVVGAAVCGTDTVPGGYEYTDDPVIGTIDPTRGPVTGGTIVTITGANLGTATSVTFDGIPGTGLTVVSDTELMVTTPAGSVGDAAVVVNSPAGASDPGVFTYFAVAAIGDTDPDSGPVAGGTTVGIVGVCFTGATAVLFGGVPATSFTVNSDTLITAVAPAGRATGSVDVTVTGAGECGTATLPGGFTYTANALAVTGGGSGATGLAVMGGILLLLGAGVSLLRRRFA
jgi:hypothetical protein